MQDLMSNPDSNTLTGYNILLVEDNIIIAMDVESMLLGLGASAVRIVETVTEALALVEAETFDFALLDVNLGRETSAPVARALQTAGAAFALMTGYGDQSAGVAEFAGAAVVTKPFDETALLRVIKPG